jgi:G3E family GTPase
VAEQNLVDRKRKTMLDEEESTALHTHSHTHHDHDHEHGQGLDHRHQASDPATTQALLNYMLEHNIHHAEELHDLAHQLDAAGNVEAASAVHGALELYQQGNAELARALDAVNGVALDALNNTALASALKAESTPDTVDVPDTRE